MTRKKGVLLFMIAVSVAWGEQQPPRSESTIEDWKFTRADINGAESATFDDSGWTKVSLPHTWNAGDVVNSNAYYRGPGWYRKHLPIAASAKGKRIFVRFEAASIVADVYFNGKHIGQHRGAFTAFCFELTDLVQWGQENLLAVRVDNSKFDDVPPLSGDFNIFGGIYRPVWLIITNLICISPLDSASPGIYLKQTKVSKEQAEVGVLTKVSNGLDKQVVVESRAKIIGDNSLKASYLAGQAEIPAGQTADVNNQLGIPSPHLWNGRKDPYLYNVQVELLCDGKVVDKVTVPLGLRYFDIDPNKGFFLNGKPCRLHGVNRHQDRSGKGWAISEQDQDEDVNIICELGANCVRSAHYPHSEYFYSACDKTGLVVWAEIPLVNQVVDTPAFRENAKQQLTELIRQQYNHPSIIFWSLYNELGNEGRSDDPRPMLTELQALAKQEDPIRFTVAASNNGSGKWPGLRNIPDLVAWNTYPGWYGGDPAMMARDLDKFYKDANERCIGVSEYGAGASILHHQQNMKKGPPTTGRWHPEEWQATAHELNYAAIEQRPFVWGSFVWVMFDFSSATRKEGDTIGVNDKGLVTADRKTKKDAFYFYKAKWSDEPVVYITSRRHVERKEPTNTVKVYSNCDSLELKVNGQSLGSKTGADCIFKWTDVPLKQGVNDVEAIGKRDGVTYTDYCEWRYAADSNAVPVNLQ